MWVIVVEKNELKAMAERIKCARKKQKITQEQAAERLNITYSSYTKIENAFQVPSLDTLISISSLLGVSLDFLVFGVGERNSDALSDNVKSQIVKAIAELQQVLDS